MSSLVVAGLSASGAVHLNCVVVKRPAVSQRTPSPVWQPVRGPWITGEVQLNPPPEWTKLVEELKAPPPVRVTAPLGSADVAGVEAEARVGTGGSRGRARDERDARDRRDRDETAGRPTGSPPRRRSGGGCVGEHMGLLRWVLRVGLWCQPGAVVVGVRSVRSVTRSRPSAARIRVLAVPSGIASRSAISRAVSPHMPASTTARRCSSGRPVSASRSRRTSSCTAARRPGRARRRHGTDPAGRRGRARSVAAPASHRWPGFG